MNDDDIHLLPIDGYHAFKHSSDESDDDVLIEVVSNIDEQENDIVDMAQCLAFSSDDELQNDHIVDHFLRSPNDKNNLKSIRDANDHEVEHNFVNNSCSLSGDNMESSSDEETFEINPANVSLPFSSSQVSSSKNTLVLSNSVEVKKDLKQKRRRWSIEEKLRIINIFESNKNKLKTATEFGCTTAQLRSWLSINQKLINLSKEKNGKLL